ncbi:MAG TPA: hypothetical protein VHJ20_11080 [Polyangia bacterium]|nr:hypothetical protein [Polyangia bacterium]
MASERTSPSLWAAALAALALGSCATDSVRRFPLRDPLWLDPDVHPMAAPPTKTLTTHYADPFDLMAFRPLSRALSVPVDGESIDVNSLDEVPNSSWFENRIGQHPMTAAEIARGACGNAASLDPAAGPWKVVSGKVDGANPGLVIKAPDGQKYLVKLDGLLDTERGTTADVIGSKIYYAAGYHVPCNEIVYFPESVVTVDANAKRKDEHGQDVRLTRADVDLILSGGWRRPDRWIRGMASRYITGAPLGPFRYEGLRADDPNDVVPHEKRRELRASMLFAAWIHHWDAIANNTLDMFVDRPGGKHVVHYILDWGDSLGALWPKERLDQRVGLGRSGYFDFDFVLTDLVTLGLVPRPWYHVSPPPMPETFGYYGTESFVPSKWRPTYANPAFSQMTVRDGLWAARIIARFSDDDVAAIVRSAHMEDASAEAFLTKTLIARRDAILREYLGAHTPLDGFTLERASAGAPQSLCFDDLAIATKVSDPATTMYRMHLHGGPDLDALLGWRQLRPDPARPARTCVPLPFGHARPSDFVVPGARDDDPARYALIEIYSNARPSLHPTASVLVHLYDLGPDRGFRIVGLERPDELRDPP